MTQLVVLSGGTAAAVRELQAQGGHSLATSLDLSWDDQWQHLSAADRPHQVLQALADWPAPQALALLGLPLDPGLPAAGGGHWAEALGAWRQPALLLLSAEQLETGLPSAMTALLQRWQVPLVGLVQWGEPWDGAARRCDGLPWLGAIGPGAAARDPELSQALAVAIRTRLARD
jgi:hypothetical protein